VARGVNLDTIEIYSQWQKGDIKNLALELGEKMKMKKINSALGLSMHNNISNIFFLLFK
jgi:tryptophanyl-tRNA synthetase